VKRCTDTAFNKVTMVTRNPKNFEFKLGKQGFLLFVGGMSLLLFTVFIIGVLVGVHIDAYPEKIAQSIPAIIRRQLSHPAVTTEKMAPVREEAKASPVREENNVVAPLPDTFVAKDDLPAGTAGTEEKKARVTVPSVAGEPVSTPQAPAVADTPLPEAGGKYSVQVGSFKSQKVAKRFCSKITPLGYKPRVAMVELRNKGKWFRVVVEGFASHDEARQAAGILAENIKGVTGIVRPVK
jgi:cell division septation protein DedD